MLSDIQVSWQHSANRVDWSPVIVVPLQVAITPGRDPSMQRLETTYPANQGMEFLRLKISWSSALAQLAH